MDLIAKHDILKRTGISERTFFWWREVGLIPRPVQFKRLKGKGTDALYNQLVLQDIKDIKRLKKTGRTLKEIKEFFTQRRSFADALGKEGIEAFDYLLSTGGLLVVKTKEGKQNVIMFRGPKHFYRLLKVYKGRVYIIPHLVVTLLESKCREEIKARTGKDPGHISLLGDWLDNVEEKVGGKNVRQRA